MECNERNLYKTIINIYNANINFLNVHKHYVFFVNCSVCLYECTPKYKNYSSQCVDRNTLCVYDTLECVCVCVWCSVVEVLLCGDQYYSCAPQSAAHSVCGNKGTKHGEIIRKREINSTNIILLKFLPIHLAFFLFSLLCHHPLNHTPSYLYDSKSF